MKEVVKSARIRILHPSRMKLGMRNLWLKSKLARYGLGNSNVTPVFLCQTLGKQLLIAKAKRIPGKECI